MQPMLSRRRFLTTSGLAATGLGGLHGFAARAMEPPATKADGDARSPALVIRDASVFDSVAGKMLPLL